MEQVVPQQDERAMAHEDERQPGAAGGANEIPNYAGFPFGVLSRLIGSGNVGSARGLGGVRGD